mgnify:CR=1 FL=1
MDTNETYIPRHRRGEEEKPRDRFFKIRNILNIIFMLGTVVGVLLYFFSSHAVGTFVLLCAIIFKIAECCLRLLR